MPCLDRFMSGRCFVGSVGILAVLAGIPAYLGFRARLPNSPYVVVDRWPLLAGGEGLFIATRAGISSDELRELGALLRDELRHQKNVVVQVFDDASAAKVARTGSRIVGEPEFAAALARQKASYVKNAATGQHGLTIFSEPVEVVQL